MSRFSSYLVQLTADVFQRFSSGSQASLVTRFSRTECLSSHSFMSRHSVLAFLLVFLTTFAGVGNVWGETVTVTYAQTSTSQASVSSGTAPINSSISFSNTYTNNKEQLTNGNHMTYTLSGYAGYKITAITLSMHSNKSGGSGTFLAKAGTTTLAQISTTTAFNQWYDNTSWSQTDFVSVHVTMTNNDYTINQNENVEITITCPSGKSNNSLYCNSITITYSSSGSGSGNPANYNIPKFAVSIPSGTIGVRCSQHSLRQHTLSRVYALSY